MMLPEWHELVRRIDGLWPGRAMPDEAIEAWWYRLRDYPKWAVANGIDALVSSHDRRPSLAQLEMSIRSERARGRRDEPARPPRPPSPSRCEWVVGTSGEEAHPVVCEGMVSWVASGPVVIGRCGACAREYVLGVGEERAGAQGGAA